MKTIVTYRMDINYLYALIREQGVIGQPEPRIVTAKLLNRFKPPGCIESLLKAAESGFETCVQKARDMHFKIEVL